MLDDLETNGFVLLHPSFDADAISTWKRSLADCLDQDQTGTLASRSKIYGSRNILQTWPQAASIPRHPELSAVVREVLGDSAGLVRTLYFDKPPGRSWSLPWHRDLTIAVRRHLSSRGEYRCPTTKAGVPHVEAPRWLLERMLTLRLHLDPMTADNGALVVIPGSHHADDGADLAQNDITHIHCEAGVVLAMRPLLSHSSVHATAGNQLQRRILHFEFAGTPSLTDGYQWHTFLPLGDKFERSP